VVAVEGFLSSHGLTAVPRTLNSDTLSVVATYAQAQELLNASYFVHTHTERPDLQVARCSSYSLPADVAGHVAFVGPTTHFPALRNPKTTSVKTTTPEEEAAAAPLYSNDPSNLRSLYGVDGAVGGPESRQAVTAFLGQYYRAEDLESFFDTYFPEGADTPIELVGDATNGGKAGVEAMLDIEYM
jgi:tripeptidyl-peptidase-1